MALNLGSKESEVVDIIFNAKSDTSGIEELVSAAKTAENLMSKAFKSSWTSQKEVFREALKQAKATVKQKEEELALVRKLKDAYIEYKRAANSDEKISRITKGSFRNIYMDTLASLEKMGTSSKKAAKQLATAMIQAELEVNQQHAEAVANRQRVLDHYYDKAISRQKQLMAAEKKRMDWTLQQVREFERDKERFAEEERKKYLFRLQASIKAENAARQKATNFYIQNERKRLQFDMKAHNTRLAYIEAEYKAKKAAQQKMTFGYTQDEARRAMALQTPTKPRSTGTSEFQGIHATDIRSFSHKVNTTFQYTTAAMMYGALVKTIYDMGKAVVDFNKYSATMAAVFRINSKEATVLTKHLEDLGNALGGEQESIYQIALALGRAGIATKDLAKASEIVIRMAYLTGDSFDQATNAIISYSEVFGKEANGGMGYTIQELGDKLAYVANVSRLSTEDIGIFSNYALGAAKAAGLTVDAVGAMAAAFSNAGMNASTIGTQIRRFTTLLSDQTTSIKKFFASVGVSQGYLRKELMASMDGTEEGVKRSNKAITDFAARLASLSDNEFAQFTSGMDLLARNSLTFLRQEASAFTTYLEGSLNKANGLLDESDKILQSYIVTWEKLVNQVKALSAAVGNSEFIARMNRGFSDILDLIGSISNETRDMLDQFGNTTAFDNYKKTMILIKEASETVQFGSDQERTAAEFRLVQLREDLKFWKEQLDKDVAAAKQAQKEDELKRLTVRAKVLESKLKQTQKWEGYDTKRAELQKELKFIQDKLKALKHGVELEAKQNEEVAKRKKMYEDMYGDLDKKIASMSYLNTVNLSSWATMISQLSSDFEGALDALTIMENLTKNKHLLRVSQATKITAYAGEDYKDMDKYISSIHDISSAMDSLKNIEYEMIVTEARLSKLQSEGVKADDERIISLTRRKEVLTSLHELAQQESDDFTQFQKAKNTVFRGPLKDLENAQNFLKTLKDSNKQLQNKIESENAVSDSTHQKSIQYLITLTDLEEKLVRVRAKNKKEGKDLEAVNNLLKAIQGTKENILNIDKAHQQKLEELEKVQFDRKASDALVKYRTELTNINLELQGRSQEQDRYVQLILLAEKARERGLEPLAQELEGMHELLNLAQKRKTLDDMAKSVDSVLKMNDKYSSATSAYEAQASDLETNYELGYIGYEEYIKKKEELDKTYNLVLKNLNADTLDAYLNMLNAQDRATQEVIDSLKNSFTDFFDYTSDGFLDLGELAKKVMHDMYMQMVQTQLIDGMSKDIGTWVSGIVNGGTTETNAHGGVYIRKFATGGVVSSPTYFPTASGVGLMGEAGAEAIMPLTRINGDLGVKAIASPVVIQVVNNTGMPNIDMKKVSERFEDDGTRIIQVVMEHAQTDPEFRSVMNID